MEIMLSKLHVTCLVIKEQIGQLSHCLRGLFSITAVKEESRYLLLRICRLGYMGQKAKKKKKSLQSMKNIKEEVVLYCGLCLKGMGEDCFVCSTISALE